MHGTFHICDLCNCKFSYVGWCDWYYDIAGHQMHISTKPAWCFDCNKLRSAENLPTVTECEREIGELTSKRTAKGTRLAHPIALKIAQLKLDWRKLRTSSPRCIWCGGTNLQYLETEPRNGLLPFIHPKCGGTIAYSSTFLGSASPTLFTPEGIRHDAKT